MIRGKFLTSMDDLDQVLSIRTRVFVEEQGFSADTEVDDYDQMAVYALVYDDGDQPAGTGRLFVDRSDRFVIGRVAVLKEARGQGLGDLVMRMLLYRALELGAGKVHIEAQLPVVPFYQKYGFQIDGGLVYEEGVPHRPMSATAQQIDIEGSCHHDGKCAGCTRDCQEGGCGEANG